MLWPSPAPGIASVLGYAEICFFSLAYDLHFLASAFQSLQTADGLEVM